MTAAGSDLRDAAATVAQRPTDRWAADMATALLALPAGAVALVAAERGEIPPRAEGRITRWLAPVSGGHPTGGGRLPPSDRNAMVHLEVNRWTGADHISLSIATRPGGWSDAPKPGRPPRPLPSGTDGGGASVRMAGAHSVSQPPDDGTAGLIARIRPTMGRELVTLAWGVSAGQLTPRLGGTVFEPPVDGEALRPSRRDRGHRGHPGQAEGRLPEARRVATRAVLRVVGRRHDLEPAWLAPSLAVPPRTTVALVGGRDGFADDGTIARVADALARRAGGGVAGRGRRGRIPTAAVGTRAAAGPCAAGGPCLEWRSVPSRRPPPPPRSTWRSSMAARCRCRAGSGRSRERRRLGPSMAPYHCS